MSQAEISTTPPEEMETIIKTQQREADWYQTYPAMELLADIQQAQETGQALAVPETGEGYKLATTVKTEFKFLSPQALAKLQEISSKWHAGLPADQKDLFLVITSLARTTQYQAELIRQGYPAVKNSTHTKLGAFDIGIQWLKTHAPTAYQNLMTILTQQDQQGEINLIEETTIQALHIAVKPEDKTKI